MACSRRTAGWVGCLVVLSALACHAQVFTVDSEHIEGRFLKFEPTHVELPKMHAGPFTQEALLRSLTAESGYAMRPLPLSSKGLDVVANGPLSPSGPAYVEELHAKGIAAHPGDRVTITKITIKNDKLILELNGGPDKPHKFLSHMQVGTGDVMMPLARDDGSLATGSRLTLIFPGGVPNVTGDEVKELIAPVVGFSQKSPLEAYVETLPPLLKNAILAHKVLVGMDKDMVLHALGSPVQKVRERDQSTLFEEWIYGTPPEKSQFVRFQQGRVVRLEIAAVGSEPVVRKENEVGDYWSTEEGVESTQHPILLGDTSAAAQASQAAAPAAVPSLRRPGEVLPAGTTRSGTPSGDAGPVQFPAGPTS
jgi:hypothetical protein